MSEEVVTSAGPSEPTIALPDDHPVVKALGMDKSKVESQPVAESQGTVQGGDVSKPAETAEVKPPETAVQPAESEKKPDKTPYTLEELKVLLSDPNAKADTSRMNDEQQVFYREFQRDYSRKMEQVKREKEQVELRRREIAEFEERQRTLEAERKFREESDQFGEEEANRLKEVREIKAELERYRWERQVSQQREAADSFKRSFAETAPKHSIPVTQGMEDMAMSYVWAQNQLRQISGQPPMTVEEGVEALANELGVSNSANFEKFISASPANKEAYDKKVIAEYLKNQSKGPTVISSSQASTPEKTSDKSKFDAAAYKRDPAAELLKIVNEKLGIT